MRNLILLAVAVLLIGGGFYFLNKGNRNTSTIPLTAVAPTSSPVSSESAKMEAKVTVTKDGFEPQTLKVKAGTLVIWENKSGQTVTVNSDPHPIHTNWPFLNLGNFDDGMTVSVRFDNIGIYTYHNHLEPTQRGTVIVE